MNIHDLKINRSTDTMGIPTENLRFSFVADYDKAFICAITDAYGRSLAKKTVSLCDATAFSFENMRLKPACRYRFSVTSDDTTATLSFETAIEFRAPFITPKTSIFAPILKRTFHVPDSTDGIRLAITGLGLYRAEINGKRVGDTYLTPGFNDYGDCLRFDTYDISPLLCPGTDNIINVHLGDGWYKGRIGIDKPADKGGEVFGADYLCALMIYRADSDEIILMSDESFCAETSPCLADSIYDGEIRDYRVKKGAALPCRIAGRTYRTVPFYGAHIRAIEELVPTLYLSSKGEIILDFGQNMVGFVRFTAALPAGTKIRLQHGEVLQNGCFYRDNLRSARAEAVYISDGGERVYEPFFTYFGFRYVLVEGMDFVDPEKFRGIVISSDMPRTCSCTTDSLKINRMIENTLWGQRGNFLDIPTDCPQRDERLGWTADTQVFAGTACYQADAFAFYNKYLADLRYDQTAYYGGDFPMYSPSLRHEAGNGGAVWADCGTILPHLLYTFYGDIHQLRRHYPMMKDYIDMLRIREHEEGDQGLIMNYFTFGDWLAQDGVCAQSLSGGTENGYISSMYYYYSTSLTADAAGILGYKTEHEEYLSAANRIRAAIIDEYFTPSGRFALDTQTAYVLSLHFGIYRNRETVIDQFKERLRKDFYKMKTGFTGTPLLLPTLFDSGMDEDAFRILYSEDCPGWLYAVNMGATTIWERWNSLLPDGRISGINMNSLNHYAYGSVCEAIYSRIAGLRPTTPGWHTALIEPHPNRRMKKIDFAYDSPAGLYAVAWELNSSEEKFSVFVSVPAGCRATLHMPNGNEELLCSGHHTRTINAPTSLLHPFSLDTPNIDIINDEKASECLLKYLPTAYALVTGENAEFTVKNGRFLLSLPMFGATKESGEAYAKALSEIKT